MLKATVVSANRGITYGVHGAKQEYTCQYDRTSSVLDIFSICVMRDVARSRGSIRCSCRHGKSKADSCTHQRSEDMMLFV